MATCKAAYRHWQNISTSNLILLGFLLLSACRSPERAEPLILQEPASPKELIDSFFFYKKIYLKEDEKQLPSLQEKWDLIVSNRDAVLAFLLFGDFDKDTTTSLYGANYDEVRSNKMHKFMVPVGSQYPVLVPENYRIEKLPNYIHALYLVEAIVHNDYLFNRRYHARFFTSPKEFLYHDGVNILCKKGVRPNVDVRYKVSYHYQEDELESFWKLYLNWYKKYQLDKQLGQSPLAGSQYYWYSRSVKLQGAKIAESIIYTQDSSLIEKYRLDYKIGNGWMASKPRRNY